MSEGQDVDLAFEEKATLAIRDLATRAQQANEIHFALALSPEFRGMQDAGWSSAFESLNAVEDFQDLLEKLPVSRGRVRVALAYYAHVAEGSGFYEIPKKLMLTLEGKGNNQWPFRDLVEKHSTTGKVISPNSNRIMKDLIGHAADLGLKELSEVFSEAFDSDVRNAIAHADYVIWADAFRIPRKHGGWARVIKWDEFAQILNRGIGLFDIIRNVSSEFRRSYKEPKTIVGQLHNEPPGEWTIYATEEGAFGICSGRTPPARGPGGKHRQGKRA